MTQNELMRNLRSMRDKSLGDKKETLTEALNLAFKTPEWRRFVDYAKKTYPYSDADEKSIRDWVRFALPELSLVWFTEKCSMYRKGEMVVLGAGYEFDGGFYDRESAEKDGVDGIYFIPIEQLTFLNKEK